MQNQHFEIKTIKKFIRKEKQDIQFASTLKSRQKFISKLSHFNEFQFDKFIQIINTPEIVTALSNAKIKTSQCYIISENRELDTNILNMEEAIQRTIGYGLGTILVF